MQKRGPDTDSLQDLREALKVFDSNKDGKLTKDEFKTAMMTMGERMQDHEIDEILNDPELIPGGSTIEINDFAQKIMNRM